MHQCGQNVELRAEMQFKWQNLEKWKIPRNRGRASFRILFAQNDAFLLDTILTNKPSHLIGHYTVITDECNTVEFEKMNQCIALHCETDKDSLKEKNDNSHSHHGYLESMWLSARL